MVEKNNFQKYFIPSSLLPAILFIVLIMFSGIVYLSVIHLGQVYKKARITQDTVLEANNMLLRVALMARQVRGYLLVGNAEGAIRTYERERGNYLKAKENLKSLVEEDPDFQEKEKIVKMIQLENEYENLADKTFRLREEGKLKEAIDLYLKESKSNLGEFEKINNELAEFEKNLLRFSNDETQWFISLINLGVMVIIIIAVLVAYLLLDLGKKLNLKTIQVDDAFKLLSQANNELEERIEERTSALKKSKEEAELAKQLADNANKAKSEFLANMSHELRTPLNGILGYTQILGRSKAIPNNEKNGINVIHQCGSHLLDLINDVLDISKIEARKLELAPSAVNLPALVQSVVEIAQIRAKQKKLDFYYTPDANLPQGVIADEKRLRQVLINLLGNAIKFTDQGSVTLKIERLNSNIDRNSFISLNFSVIDTGVGISEENINKLFQAFQQVGDHSRQTEGTGLGLAISQQIVQLMGGQIKIESKLGVGSKFFFKLALPLNVESALDQTSNITNSNRAGNIISYNGDQKHILIIDDRWANRAVLVSLLEPIGFILSEAENGKVGLEKIRENLPDLIITDLAMPVMDGFDFIKQLRNDENFKHLKVVVSSASVAKVDQQMSFDAGADGFLAKPVNAQYLFNLLAKYLQITWNYEEIEVVNQPEVIFPPVVELEQIYQASRIGDMDLVINEAYRLEQLNSEYKSFATRLINFVDNFDDAGILKFLEPMMRSP